MTALPRALIICLLGACALPDTDPAANAATLVPERSDSAGVTILTHSAGAFERAPRINIDSAPLAVIAGSADDLEADISTIRPVLFLGDGRLVGIDQQRQVIVVFGPDGVTRQEFGRQGAGPGEYGRLNNIVPGNGDTLLVADYMNNRVGLLDPDRGPMGEFPLSAPMTAGGNSPIGMIGDRILLTGVNYRSGSEEPPGIKGILFDPASDVARRTFTTGPEERPEEAPRQITTSNGAVLVAVRAISIPALAVFPRAFAWNGETVIADGNRFRLEWWDTAGTRRRQLRINRQRMPVTSAVWEAHVSGMIAQSMGSGSVVAGGTVFFGSGGGTPDTALMRKRLADQPHADSLPLFERTQLGPDGTLWVVDYPVPGSSGWAATAFAADGRLLGRVSGDSGAAPLVFGDDRAVFWSEDDLGIATLTIRKLIFPK